jgi:hypothetical protein
MPVATWPSTLPQTPFIGFQVSHRSPVERFAADRGPEKVRRDGLRARVVQRTPCEIDGEQLATFRTFWQDTLLAGTQRFTWINFETGDSAECRFTREPEWDNKTPATDPDDYRFTGNLEMEVF